MTFTNQMATSPAIYVSEAIDVSVPEMADAECDSVAVDVSALTFAPKVGDAVIAIPQEALPLHAILCGAYVTDDDEVTVSFAATEGGTGVSVTSRSFKFLYVDLT